MAQLLVTGTDAQGLSGSVTIEVVKDVGGGATPLSGDVSGTFGDCFVAGDLNLTGDLFVEGTMTGIDTFHVQGNGFTVFFQNGGRVDLHGKFKAAWGLWGTDTSGWQVGDRVAVAPTRAIKTLPLAVMNWAGSWSGMTRPVDAPDVTLIDGSVQKPEVVNLSQTITIENLARGFHFHNSAGVQSLSDVRFLNCGTDGILGNYPVHFHQLYDNSRGSFLERVVVEGGKNHAFVPHGSHGVTLRDCVAYNTLGDVYWWDPPDPNDKDDPTDPNNSNDLLFERCLSLHNDHPSNPPRLTAFFIGAGTNNEWVGCVAVGVQGGKDSSGYRWTEHHVAVFNGGNKAHNCRSWGIFTWTNSTALHTIDGVVFYHNRRGGIEHGAYVNPFIYRNAVIHMDPIVDSGSDLTNAVEEHAMSGIGSRGLLFENILSNDRLRISVHSVAPLEPAIHRNCTYTGVIYNEGNPAQPTDNPSIIHFEDCGLVPADFTFTSIQPDSIIEIYEGGVLTHRWAGAWS